MKAHIESDYIAVTVEMKPDNNDAEIEEIDIYAVAQLLFAAVVGVGFDPRTVGEVVKTEGAS